jgi:SAM-dependent methyltransferase
MLDVGCGAGAARRRFRDAGWIARGVEPDPRAVRVGRAHGLDIVEGVLRDGRFPDAWFDYARLDHSFEHLRCARETLRELRRILRPGGRLFLSLPEFESTTRRWFGGHWWFLGLPVHTYQYSRRTLPRLLESEGFAVESARVRPHLGGTLGSLEIRLNHGRAPGRPRIDLMRSSPLRTLGQWAAVLIALLGTGEVLEVTAMRPEGGPAR